MSDTTTAAKPQAPGFYRFALGDFTAVALHDGAIVRDRPADFVRNAGPDEVGEAFAACGMARNKLTPTFNALAIETGAGTVLIDTGLGAGAGPGAGQLMGNLAAAGGSEPRRLTRRPHTLGHPSFRLQSPNRTSGQIF